MACIQDLSKVLVASRPASWTFGPILFGIGVILSHQTPKTLPGSLVAALQAFSLSVPLCVIVFGINDVHDFLTDSRNPRKIANGLQGGVLAREHHPLIRTSAYVSTCFIIGISLLTRRPYNIVTTLFLLFFGWQYSAPPLRLKEVPVFDSLSNGLIVFLTLFCGFSFSGRDLLEVPSQALMLGLCTSGIHAMGAVIDIDADMAAGQQTIATALGQRTTAIFSTVCYFLAATSQDPRSIFGIYLWMGTLVMLIPCLKVSLAQRSFEVIVCMSIISAVSWLFVRVMARVA